LVQFPDLRPAKPQDHFTPNPNSVLVISIRHLCCWFCDGLTVTRRLPYQEIAISVIIIRFWRSPVHFVTGSRPVRWSTTQTIGVSVPVPFAVLNFVIELFDKISTAVLVVASVLLSSEAMVGQHDRF